MWEELYDTFWDQLERYCVRLCRDESWAEELTQDTFLKALQNWKLLAELSSRQRKSWLFQTAHNLYCDQVRRAMREDELLQRLLPADGEETDEAALTALNTVELDELLSLLCPEDRTLFMLRYEQGYTAAELGKLFHLPPATIRTRLARARKKLKNNLMEE